MAIIRKSRSVETARNNLMKQFRLSERQAQAILDLRLQRLTALERQKVEQEHRDLVEKIEYLEGVLADDDKVYEIVKEELLEVRATYDDERRTQITVDEDTDFEIEDLIAEEEMVISISNGGYLKSVPSMDAVYETADLFLITEQGFGKRTALSQFRAQGRGGQGVIAMKTDGDRGRIAGVRVVRPDLHELVIVSNFGTTIRIDAESVSRQGRNAQGVRVMNLRTGDSVSAIAKVVSSRATDADGAVDELTLEEIAGGADSINCADGASQNGEVTSG